jgi:hypothetical protein
LLVGKCDVMWFQLCCCFNVADHVHSHVLFPGNEHKKLFYEKYYSEWTQKIKRTNLISEKIYKKIVKVLLNFNRMLGRWKKHYHILSNQESNCLYHRVPARGREQLKRVPTYANGVLHHQQGAPGTRTR